MHFIIFMKHICSTISRNICSSVAVVLYLYSTITTEKKNQNVLYAPRSMHSHFLWAECFYWVFFFWHSWWIHSGFVIIQAFIAPWQTIFDFSSHWLWISITNITNAHHSNTKGQMKKKRHNEDEMVAAIVCGHVMNLLSG